MANPNASSLQSLKIQLAMVKDGDRDCIIVNHMALVVTAATLLETIQQPGFPTQPTARFEVTRNLATAYKEAFANETDYALTFFKRTKDMDNLLKLCANVLEKDIETIQSGSADPVFSPIISNRSNVSAFGVEQLLRQLVERVDPHKPRKAAPKDLAQYEALKTHLKSFPEFSACSSAVSKVILKSISDAFVKAERDVVIANHNFSVATVGQNVVMAVKTQSDMAAKQKSTSPSKTSTDAGKKPRVKPSTP